MSEKNSRATFKKVVTIISGIAFFWFSASTVIKMMVNPQPQPNAMENNDVDNSATAQLEREAQGYELVLQKEPNNRFALEKLVEINLQLSKLEATVPLIENLLVIDPDNQQYQEVLAIVQKGIEEQNSENSLANSSEDETETNQDNSP